MIVNAKKQIQSIRGKILLALSGGPDSMFLYHLLKMEKKEFHVAHVDHGLQKSSQSDRMALQSLAKIDNVPFHFCTLEGFCLEDRNLEDRLREKRISFFKEVMEKEGLGVVCLGHQKDERCETILKRFFEGGNLFHLFGIKKESVLGSMKVLRPLLNMAKKDIFKYLEANGIAYFTDVTNLEGDNLRATMRSEMIPFIEGKFKKNIVNSVCDLGDQAIYCMEYLQREVDKASLIEVSGPFGSFFPYNEFIDPYIHFQLILSAVKKSGVTLSRQMRSVLKESIDSRASRKKIELQLFHICFEDVGVFFLYSNVEPSYGCSDYPIDWLEFWKDGKAHIDYKEITRQEFENMRNGKVISEICRVNKVPFCLRKIFPISLTTIAKNINM